MAGSGFGDYEASYRETLSLEEAMREIEHGVSTQFDPQVVAVFQQLVEQVADSAYPVYECLKPLGAQQPVVYQDDTGARILSLMPWNRQEPFTLELLKRTVFSPPVRGNILQGLPPE